jgi:hypothetical protein
MPQPDLAENSVITRRVTLLYGRAFLGCGDWTDPSSNRKPWSPCRKISGPASAGASEFCVERLQYGALDSRSFAISIRASTYAKAAHSIPGLSLLFSDRKRPGTGGSIAGSWFLQPLHDRSGSRFRVVVAGILRLWSDGNRQPRPHGDRGGTRGDGGRRTSIHACNGHRLDGTRLDDSITNRQGSSTTEIASVGTPGTRSHSHGTPRPGSPTRVRLPRRLEPQWFGCGKSGSRRGRLLLGNGGAGEEPRQLVVRRTLLPVGLATPASGSPRSRAARSRDRPNIPQRPRERIPSFIQASIERDEPKHARIRWTCNRANPRCNEEARRANHHVDGI